MADQSEFAVEDKHVPWTVHWIECNHVDWECTVCSRQNAYATTHCNGCGKVASSDANQRVDDVAATMIQCLVRERQAFGVLKAKAKSIYVKHLDKASGEEYFANSATGGTSWFLPSFITSAELADNNEYVETQAWVLEEKNKADDRERARVELAAERKERTDKEREEKEAQEAIDLADIWDPVLEASRER
jgi:hypothetical protein